MSKISANFIKQAKTPHELFMLNLALFHLLATPASIALDIGLWGFFIPLAFSLSFISYVWYRAKQSNKEEALLITGHWELARQRTVILLIGYSVAGLILLLGTLIASNSSMGNIMMVAISRIAVVPIILVMLKKLS